MKKTLPVAIFIGSIVIANTQLSWAQPINILPLESPERKAILNALRPAVEAEVNQKVVFHEVEIRTFSGWAFVSAIAKDTKGKRLGIGDPHVDPAVTSLLRKKGSNWHILQWGQGTGVAAVYEARVSFPRAPASIFPFAPDRKKAPTYVAKQGQSSQRLYIEEASSRLDDFRAATMPIYKFFKSQDIGKSEQGFVSPIPTASYWIPVIATARRATKAIANINPVPNSLSDVDDDLSECAYQMEKCLDDLKYWVYCNGNKAEDALTYANSYFQNSSKRFANANAVISRFQYVVDKPKKYVPG